MSKLMAKVTEKLSAAMAAFPKIDTGIAVGCLILAIIIDWTCLLLGGSGSEVVSRAERLLACPVVIAAACIYLLYVKPSPIQRAVCAVLFIVCMLALEIFYRYVPNSEVFLFLFIGFGMTFYPFFITWLIGTFKKHCGAWAPYLYVACAFLIATLVSFSGYNMHIYLDFAMLLIVAGVAWEIDAKANTHDLGNTSSLTAGKRVCGVVFTCVVVLILWVVLHAGADTNASFADWFIDPVQRSTIKFGATRNALALTANVSVFATVAYVAALLVSCVFVARMCYKLYRLSVQTKPTFALVIGAYTALYITCVVFSLLAEVFSIGSWIAPGQLVGFLPEDALLAAIIFGIAALYDTGQEEVCAQACEQLELEQGEACAQACEQLEFEQEVDDEAPDDVTEEDEAIFECLCDDADDD